MEKDFDFKNIGKQMPYRTPDTFFEKMQERAMRQAQVEKRVKSHRMKLIVATSLAVAAMLLGILFFPMTSPEVQQHTDTLIVSAQSTSSDSMDEWIGNLSDDELEEWTELSENDIFIN